MAEQAPGLPTPGDVVLGRYEVLDRIGAGGFGVVWRARDEVLGREVALKRIVREPDVDPEHGRERTLREGRALARVAHPAVVAIHDLVLDDDVVWLVLEYVPGSTLDLLVAREGRRPPAEVAAIGATLATALAHGHAGGLVHRDVKPANVLVDDRGDGGVKLADYGIARLVEETHDVTASRQRHGSLPWASPEWARNEEVTAASDVFSLGATLFHAVEGRPPFADEAPGRALVLEVAAGRVLPAPHAGPLDAVLTRMLDPDPRARPAAADVAATLSGLATAGEGHDTAAAPAPPPVPPSAPPPPPARTSRRRLGIAALAALLVAVLVAGGLWASGLPAATPADDPLSLPAGGLAPVVDPGRHRDVDPCAVVDTAPLRPAYGAATVTPGAYLSACTILLRRPGSSSTSRLTVDLLEGSDSTADDDRRPIGAGYVVGHPASEGCRATVTLDVGISIIFRTLADDRAVDPCRLLDGAVALAVRGLNAHGLVSRPGRTLGWPLALVDACTLATRASLAPVGLDGQVSGPQSSNWGRWDCRWGRDVAGGSSVELALRLEDPDDPLGRGPLAVVAGRTVVTEVGDGDLNPRRCTTGVLWRPVANPPGLVQVIEAKVDAPGADARLCRAATGIVTAAADLLDARR